MSEKFGEKIRKIRNRRKKTLEEMAEAVGTSKAYVWQLENKKNAKPSADLLLKVANYLGESPDFFMDDSLDEPSEDQLDDAFFRKFKKLSANDKRTVDRIMSGLDEDDKQPSD